MKPATFLGLRTAIYPVRDLPAAKAWYAKVLSIDPYFDESFYVGFNVGGFELGLDPDTGATPTAGHVATAYWGVDDARQTYERLLSLGATAVSEVHDVGGGILVATVKDPFGNALGIIENPHFPNQA